MGEIVLLQQGMEELLPMLDRSPGTHVSSVINSLCVRMGYHEERDEGDRPPQTMLELGCALEHAIASRLALQYPNRFIQVGELELDGMFGTPDLLNFEHSAVEEVKLTWMSSNQPVDGPKMWKYWVQIKAYCWMMKWSIGRLRVCHINGDWKFNSHGPNPIYNVWEQRFTRLELEKNWTMLIKHAEKMRG